MRTRTFGLLIFLVVATAAVIARLFALQIGSHAFYQNLADNQHQLYKVLEPARGQIFVQDGSGGKTTAVATNVDQDFVYAVPPEIRDKEKTAAVLARVLEMPRADILTKIGDNNRKWVSLKKQLPQSVSHAIAKLNLDGIHLQPETNRLYPEKDFASQVLGFLGFQGANRVGQYGIEEYFQKFLAGRVGDLTQDTDLGGRWITGGLRRLQPSQDGSDVVLTLDRAIQFKADEIIKSAVQTYGADSGSIVVMSPKTGAILAMANAPSFDPNNFGKASDPGVYRNLSISGAFEPGSVFKAVTMAAGLNAGAITPDTTYEDTGSVTLSGFVIKNALEKVHGVQTMTQVLEQSINTGAIYAWQQTGKDKFLQTVKDFGFGAKTGITLPGEAPGDVSSLSKNGDVFYATASFGQGITVTPLQLALAYATIANQGRMMKPFIVQSIRYPDHTETTTPQQVRQVISPDAANKLTAMLVSVVENGHGKRAGVPGYYLAGKTGTAQVARTDGAGYDPDRTIGTFAGFGPVDNPAFAVVVKIVNPKNTRFAESSAAPTFGVMAQFLLNYFQIPPTR